MIKTMIRLKGITVREAAELCGVPTDLMVAWYKLGTVVPIEQVARVADALGFTLVYDGNWKAVKR